MSSLKQRKLGQAGFSLIELMIVVAIIGILATIAIPNFNRFQAKAKQSEAKSNLSGLYTAEKAFFAEWNQYYADFRDIGFSPEGRLNYTIGFSGAGIVSPLTPYNGPSGAGAGATAFNTTIALAAPNAQPVANIPTAAAVASSGACTNSSAPPAGGAGVAGTFVALARGDLHPSSGKIDEWTADQNKFICNNTDGTL